jgi:predicted MFS family arabinose efflux permease
MKTNPDPLPKIDVSKPKTATGGWASVAALAPGAFALATTEFIPLGLIQPVAREFTISLGSAGLMILVPGLVAAIAAPLAVIGAGRLPRKTFVLTLGAVLLAANLLATFAPSFAILLVARGLSGLALGGFWAVVPILAAQLVPTVKRHRATSIVISGISAGTVVGLPAGQFIGNVLGWRAAFAAVAVLAAVILIVQAIVLPHIAARPGLRPSVFLDVLKNRAARLGLYVTVPAIVAQFAASTFVTPFLTNHVRLGSTTITILLLAYGVAGILGTLVGGALVARSHVATLVAAVLLMGVAVVVLALSGTLVIPAEILVVVWGLAWGIIPIAMQTWMMAAVPHAPEAASATLVTTFQLSIALGALVGGVVVDSAGLCVTFVAAGALALAAGIFALVSSGRAHRSSNARSS